jgi:hypothetical protein
LGGDAGGGDLQSVLVAREAAGPRQRGARSEDDVLRRWFEN